MTELTCNISARNGINNSFASFYDIYSARREKPASKIAISKILATDLDIKVFQKRLRKDRYKWLNISFESLYTIYKNKGWIHDTDEINSPEEYLEDIKQSDDLQDNVKPELFDIQQLEDLQKELKPELSNIKQLEDLQEDIKESKKDIKPELIDIQQPEDLQEELKPELLDGKQSEDDVKEPEETLDEFIMSLFPQPKKEPEFEIEIDFEELDALLA